MRSIARLSFRHHWAVLGAAVAIVAGLFLAERVAGGEFTDSLRLPGSESQQAFDLLAERGFESRAGFSGQIVFTAPDVTAAPVRQGMEALFEQVGSVIDGQVVSPYGQAAAGQISPDGTVAFAELNLNDQASGDLQPTADRVRDLVAAADVPGTRVELGGDVFAARPQFSSELYGFVAATIILLIAFGSVLAMGLPLVTALFGIIAGISLVGLAVNVIGMPTFSNQAVAMIGIGVGIDYALLIVTRYREGLHGGFDPQRATEVALDTAGRSVLFAGCTVVVAVLGLLTINLSLIRGLAVGISLGVAMTMLSALLVLPAALGVVGRHIDRLGLPHRRGVDKDPTDTWGFRWSRVIQRRSWAALIVGVAVLGVLALPTAAIRLGFGDAGNRPTSDTTRRAYDLIAEGFGPGFNGPLLVAAALPRPGDLAVVEEVAGAIRGADGVQLVTPPQPNPAGDAAVMQVFPTTSPQSEATAELVDRLRQQVIPPAVAGSDLEVHVGGVTAAGVDFSDYTAGRMPWFIGAVLLVSFLLLMLVFRSVLVPLKAVIVNLLSVGAAYGVMVAVFQWGWAASLIGIGREGPIDAWVPIMLFAVIFGLSMDYEVFLLSRIQERYDRTGDNGQAVADGLAATARVISAAAAIMFFVFLSFVLSPERSLKLFGVGLAVAVLLDATLVRLVVVPATMELLGSRNWWLPRQLRWLPTISVDPEIDTEPPGQDGSSRATPGGDGHGPSRDGDRRGPPPADGDGHSPAQSPASSPEESRRQ